MIPLTSDTETHPTEAMRAAIAAAPVGDEQRREDPTVNLLLERVAELLGKEAALFLPTGTMCNLIAVKTHTRAGDLMLAEREAHVLRAEAGGAGLVSGVLTEPLFGGAGGDARIAGTFTATELGDALDRLTAMPAPYAPPATLLCVEQTHNFGGGSIWPRERLAAVCAKARDRGLAIHMDGARLLNAAVASGVSASQWCSHVDSAWIDFTKGLGAPIGSVLAGSREFIARAYRYKYAFGGAMRQAGIAAAGCLHALDHHIERLADDHANAARLAGGIAALPGLRLVYGMPQTNIVFFEPEPDTISAAELARRCLERGLRIGTIGGKIRAVTHLDVSRAQVDEALAIMADALR
ncbi:MAG: low specificity L-threonine aldolase [Burkholderiaceae bacterium]|nr:low specificity L-threonine aldolase [Burkholderiaceae bacterium]